jgi:hypothetical protein
MDRMNARPLQMGGGLPGMGASAAYPAPAVPDGYRRVFRAGTTTAHYLDDLDDPALGTPAACGTEPVIGQSWKGPGSWGETQTLNRMHTCRRCVKAVEKA